MEETDDGGTYEEDGKQNEPTERHRRERKNSLVHKKALVTGLGGDDLQRQIVSFQR